MKRLTELVLRLCDLGEAEGRVLRENAKTVGIGCALAGLGLVFAAAAFALIAISVYSGLLAILPMPACLLILALFCAVIALLFLFYASKWLKNNKAD